MRQFIRLVTKQPQELEVIYHRELNEWHQVLQKDIETKQVRKAASKRAMAYEQVSGGKESVKQSIREVTDQLTKQILTRELLMVEIQSQLRQSENAKPGKLVTNEDRYLGLLKLVKLSKEHEELDQVTDRKTCKLLKDHALSAMEYEGRSFTRAFGFKVNGIKKFKTVVLETHKV